MNPYIALILVLFFILLSLKLDSKNASDNSKYLWIPIIWIILSIIKPIPFFFNVQDNTIDATAYTEGNPLYKNIYSVLILIGIYIIYKRKVSLFHIISSNKLIFIWFLYCAFSIAWSDYPAISFRRWIKGAGVLIMIVVIMTEKNPIEAVKTVIKKVSFFLIPLSIVLIKYFREYGVSYSPWGGAPTYGGVANDKNGLGRLCLVCGLFYVWDTVEKRRNNKLKINNNNKTNKIYLNVAYIIMITWLIIKSRSMTSVVSLMLGLLIFMILGMDFVKKDVINNTRKLLFLSLFIVVILFPILLFVDFDSIVNTFLHRDATLTGRTELWKDILSMQKSPWLGVGYDGFWLGDRLDLLWNKYWWKPNEAHNGYLDTYVELGFVGLALLFFVLISMYKSARDKMIVNMNYGRFCLTVFMISLIYNVTEAAFSSLSFIWFMLILVTFRYQNDLNKNDGQI